MEKSKEMKALTAMTMRELIRIVNEEEIQREDLVSIIKEGEYFIAVYYG